MLGIELPVMFEIATDFQGFCLANLSFHSLKTKSEEVLGLLHGCP